MPSLEGWDVAQFAARSLIVPSLVCLALLVGRRAPAALRHALILWGMLATVGLPLIASYLPSFDLAVLPAIGGEMEIVSSTPVQPAETGSSLLGVLYLAGALLVLTRLAGGWFFLHLASRCAHPVTNQRPLGILKVLRWELGVRGQVRMVTSKIATMPVTWGFVRPAILLPPDSAAWSDRKIRAILLHELAHISRRDCATQLLAHFVCAALWFNPLIWLCAALLKRERERACDDYVLRDGEAPSGYASLLVAMSRRLRGMERRLVPGAAFGSAPLLATRVGAILDAQQSREAFPRFAGTGALLLLCTLGLGSTMLNLTPKESRAALAPIAAAADEQELPQTTIPDPEPPDAIVAPARPEPLPVVPPAPEPLTAAPVSAAPDHSSSPTVRPAVARAAPSDRVINVAPVIWIGGRPKDPRTRKLIQETIEKTLASPEVSLAAKLPKKERVKSARRKSAKILAFWEMGFRIVLRK